MTFSRFAALVPVETPLGRRLAVLGACIAFGVWMILVGRVNLRTREAEETGKRALFQSLMGRSTTMKGKAAVATGWMRIVVGALAIVFGFVFLFFGEFLKK